MIDLIYETAIEPGQWPELLSVLAGFIEQHTPNTFEGSKISEDPRPCFAADALAVPKVSLSQAFEEMSSSEEVREQNPHPSAIDQDAINLILLRHFTKAIKIAKRLIDLEEKHEAVVSLLDHLPIALVVVDEEAAVLETNNRADQMLLDQTHLRTIEGRLHARFHAQSKRIHQAIKAVLQQGATLNPGQALTLSDDSDAQNDLMLFITPIGQNEAQAIHRLAIFASTRISQPLVISRQVSNFYGLTPKEMEVTAALVQGLSIKEICSNTEVSEHTVRSQVKAVLSKTNTGRQAELVRLILTGPGSMITTGLQKYQVDQNTSRLIFKGRPLPDVPKFIFLSDGRRMSYREYGDPKGQALFFCHSILGSRLETALNAEAIVRQRKVRLIVPDRPGVGCSDPNAKLSFLQWADDLESLADFLRIKRFDLSGYAMGAQYALACAYILPQRIRKVLLISGGFPLKTPEDFEKTLPFYRFNLKLALHAPPLHRLLVSMMRKGFYSNPESFFKQLSEKLAEGDRPIFEAKDFREKLQANITEGWRQSAYAQTRDAEQLMRPWGFKVSDIQTPVDLWHGETDHHVPCTTGIRLAEALPNVRSFIRPAQGHLMFFSHWAEMLDVFFQFSSPLL